MQARWSAEADGELLVEASHSLDLVADELIRLGDGWAAAATDPGAVEWLLGLVTTLGWWSGRLLEASGAPPGAPARASDAAPVQSP